MWVYLSEGLLISALVLYAAAALAFCAGVVLARVTAVAVPAGAPLPPAEPPTPNPRAAAASRLGVVLTVLAAVPHVGGILTRGLAAGRTPLSDMFDFAVASALVTTAAYLLIGRRTGQLRQLGLLAVLPVTITMTLALVALYDEPGALVPALRSVWLEIHVSAAAIGIGTVTVGTVGCAVQLYAQRKGRAELVARADAVARAAYGFAFPVWTFAVTTGAVWAEQAWGRYWGWDPKEIWAFISWVLLAAYLHSRHTAGANRRTTAIVGVVAYGCLLFNFVGVNIWFTSLHSYAGL